MPALEFALGLIPPGAGIALDLDPAGVARERHAPDLLALGAFGFGIANRFRDEVRVQPRLDQIGVRGQHGNLRIVRHAGGSQDQKAKHASQARQITEGYSHVNVPSLLCSVSLRKVLVNPS